MRKVLLIITSLLVSVTINAQEKTLKDNLVKRSSSNYKVDDIQATGDKVTIKDGSTILMEVINEGDGGSIYLEPLTADITSFDNKLYNFGTELYWSGDPLGTSRNVGWETSISTVRLNSINDKVGIGINSPSAKLHVQGDDGVLFEGTFGSGTIPKEGAGTRMMWYPKKAAFRAGFISDTEWDDANIGAYSTALGLNSTASGITSIATGNYSVASGNYSMAIGRSIASGEYSSAVGNSNAEGDYSIALGGSSALGVLSTAMGYTTTSSFFSTSIGTLNIGGGSSNTWIETDPLFEIGNSNDPNNRSNALTVLKNGHVGIATHIPLASLHVNGIDGVVFEGDESSGIIPWEGTGVRMMWYPKKAAFRVGYASNELDAKIGNYSATFNIGNEASGLGSSAFGADSKAIGLVSLACGGECSATGDYSTAIGRRVNVSSFASTAIGYNNIGGGNSSNWINTDPLFEIGNGFDGENKSNALTVLKNGNIGIGTVTPERLLHLNGANPRILIEAASSNPEINFKNNGDLSSDIWSVYKNGTTDNLQFYQNGNKVTIQKNTGNVGIGTTNPNSKLSIVGLSEYDNNAAALAAGLVAGDLYRSGDFLKIVH